MSEETKTQNTEQQPTNSTPEDNGGQGGEKMFTQDEVNRIVQDRLAKERAKNENPSEREQELNAREARLVCREYLAESGAPSVLLDVLDTSDPEKFKEAAEKLHEAGFKQFTSTGLSHSASSWVNRTVKTGLSHQNAHDVGGGFDDKLADAFKSKG